MGSWYYVKDHLPPNSGSFRWVSILSLVSRVGLKSIIFPYLGVQFNLTILFEPYFTHFQTTLPSW